MPDTSICSFIMREPPPSLLARLSEAAQRHRIVISAITYAEMRYRQIGKNASPTHKTLIDECVVRLDAVLAWDTPAVDATVGVMAALGSAGTPIGPNDAAIAGHAIASKSVLVTNNVGEFMRVPLLAYEDWT